MVHLRAVPSLVRRASRVALHPWPPAQIEAEENEEYWHPEKAEAKAKAKAELKNLVRARRSNAGIGQTCDWTSSSDDGHSWF